MNRTTSPSPNPHHRTHRFRYSIAALLFVMLCVAGILAGYRIGFHQGYLGGERKLQSQMPFPKVYDVAGLLIPRDANPSTAIPDYASLINAITATVASDSWDNVGGPGSITAMPSNRTLVISQTRDNHERIDSLFQQMRQTMAIKKQQQATNR